MYVAIRKQDESKFAIFIICIRLLIQKKKKRSDTVSQFIFYAQFSQCIVTFFLLSCLFLKSVIFVCSIYLLC